MQGLRELGHWLEMRGLVLGMHPWLEVWVPGLGLVMHPKLGMQVPRHWLQALGLGTHPSLRRRVPGLDRRPEVLVQVLWTEVPSHLYLWPGALGLPDMVQAKKLRRLEVCWRWGIPHWLGVWYMGPS